MNANSNLESGRQATLASTGEPVRILYRITDGRTDRSRYRCVLPPQAPGHDRRVETIRTDRLA